MVFAGSHPGRLTRLSGSFVVTAAFATAMALIGCVLFVIWKFPFRRDALVRQVESRTGARLDIGTFQVKWFPPGFAAERVRLSDRDGDVLKIDAIALQGSYVGLLRSPKTLTRIHALGLRLLIPSQKMKGNRETLSLFGAGGSHPALAAGEIRLDNAALDLLPATPDRPPLEFVVHTLVLTNVGLDKPVAFDLSLHNPRPPGEIRSHGEFGPLDMTDPGRARVSGAFTFTHADLTVPRGIAGLLNASGNFHGQLSRLDCSGTADVPDFQVSGSSNSVHISARFDTAVDALTGSAVLNSIVAHFRNTTVSAVGNVASGSGGTGKTVTLETAVREGRVEDLLLLFTRRTAPAMRGPISLKAKFAIPPGPPDFLTRLKIDGEFAIKRGHFTNPKTQTSIDRLSASAEGESKREQREYPTLAAADIRASVTDRNGVARLSNIVFEAPGVRGRLAGTFALEEKKVALSGILQTRGNLSDTTSGVKALMLKVMGPLWPKNASVRSIPFGISGKASHPVFRLKLHG
jgi:hypothetical protein